MEDKVLRAALVRLHGHDELPASQFTASQRSALDRFARQTGAVRCLRQGRGEIYRIVEPAVFATHLTALSPRQGVVPDSPIPQRAQHIAEARDSKARSHRHEQYYLLLKAVGEDVLWRESGRSIELPLDQMTRNYGAATLVIDDRDAWSSEGDLWLVENQALFDQADWLPMGTSASVAYYGGQLNGVLLNWLGSRSRVKKVIHFPDYDGVGLANFARLYAVLGDACQFWLMPHWTIKLDRYGSRQLWRDTLRDFTRSSKLLPEYLAPLIAQMRQSGRALEQEAIWLPGEQGI
jgi:hypothetical protein